MNYIIKHSTATSNTAAPSCSVISPSAEVEGTLVPALTIGVAKTIAERLRVIVEQTSLKLGQKRYVRVEGWKSIAAEDGCCPAIEAIEWVEAAGNRPGGVRAKAALKRLSDGAVITTAYGFVGDDEPMWKNRAQFAREGMAQTRALSRACKHRYDYVVVLMGAQYSTTPAEEMGGEEGGDTGAGRQKTGNDVPERETISGVVKGASSSQYKGKTYYFAEVDGRKLMSGEPAIGQALVEAEGQEIEALCVHRAGKGPNDYRVISFTYPEPVTDAPSDESNDAAPSDNPF
jgi:hypothetical protein